MVFTSSRAAVAILTKSPLQNVLESIEMLLNAAHCCGDQQWADSVPLGYRRGLAEKPFLHTLLWGVNRPVLTPGRAGNVVVYREPASQQVVEEIVNDCDHNCQYPLKKNITNCGTDSIGFLLESACLATRPIIEVR
jgi:hypothetical protein